MWIFWQYFSFNFGPMLNKVFRIFDVLQSLLLLLVLESGIYIYRFWFLLTKEDFVEQFFLL